MRVSVNSCHRREGPGLFRVEGVIFFSLLTKKYKCCKAMMAKYSHTPLWNKFRTLRQAQDAAQGAGVITGEL